MLLCSTQQTLLNYDEMTTKQRFYGVERDELIKQVGDTTESFVTHDDTTNKAILPLSAG